MKDWRIYQSMSGPYLHHQCGNGLHHPSWYTCSYHTENKWWFCLRCLTRAPQEIQDVADLANCNDNRYSIPTGGSAGPP